MRLKFEHGGLRSQFCRHVVGDVEEPGILFPRIFEYLMQKYLKTVELALLSMSCGRMWKCFPLFRYIYSSKIGFENGEAGTMMIACADSKA
jgi:hypothetical protein